MLAMNVKIGHIIKHAITQCKIELWIKPFGDECKLNMQTNLSLFNVKMVRDIEHMNCQCKK